MAVKNYLDFDGLITIFRRTFMYIDSPEHLGDKEFINQKLRVWFKGSYVNPSEPYQMVVCKVRKRDVQKFYAAMEALPRRMLLMGHEDYEEYCEGMIPVLEASRGSARDKKRAGK